MRKISLFVILLFVLGVGPGWGAVCPIETKVGEWADSSNYPVKIGGMFLRGIHSVVKSPIEIFYHPYDELKHRPQYGLGFFKGLGIGAVWMFDHVLRGVWDVATAPIPDYNGEPGDHDDFEKEETA